LAPQGECGDEELPEVRECAYRVLISDAQSLATVDVNPAINRAAVPG
jgi:hypothetical protein